MFKHFTIKKVLATNHAFEIIHWSSGHAMATVLTIDKKDCKSKLETLLQGYPDSVL